MKHMITKALAAECIKGLGPFGNFCEEAATITGGPEQGAAVLGKISNIISRLLGVVTIVAFLWFLLQFISGAFAWLNSGGDEGKLVEARNRITNAGLGLILVVGVMAIMGLVQSFFGINFLDLESFSGSFLNPNVTPAQTP